MSEQTIKGRILEVKQDKTTAYSSIQAAVNDAEPGDTILVYDGIYREEIVFPQGGLDEKSRIALKAAGENVTITGSNRICSGWEHDIQNKVYVLKLPKEYFGMNAEGEYFNPFHVRWMAKGFQHTEFFTCGCVYINEIPMAQQWTAEDVGAKENSWYAEVDPDNGETILYANFGELNPVDACNTVEINVRMQCITAVWNQGYITIDGIKVTHGCGPKTIDFWMTNAEAMYGAIATNGGHHWIIENCNVVQNRGVAIDFGCGSAKQELRYGGEPDLYGYHIIRNNKVQDNATNGIMAYRGAYTEIYGNKLVNNDALDTGLASEAYIKDVSGGWGINIHDNYFYSDQDWSCFPIWLDSECDMCRVSRNVFYCRGEGKGFSSLDYECNGGWNLIDNNIFVGVGIALFGTTGTYFVNNLWLDINEDARTWPQKGNTAGMGAEGYDGYSRSMRLVEPGTLKLIGKEPTSRFQTFDNYNKMLGNMMFGTGLTNTISPMPGMDGEKISGSLLVLLGNFSGGEGPSLEPEENLNNIYAEVVLDRTVDEKTGEPAANADYSGGCWKGFLPKASEEEKIAAVKYKGVIAWIPADEENKALLQKQITEGDVYSTYGNECDYNVYMAGAQKIDNPEYGASHGYHAEIHSLESKAGSYQINATKDAFSITLEVDDVFQKTGFTTLKGKTLGISEAYRQAAEKYVENVNLEEYYPDDVDVDYFGTTRETGFTAVGPFADLKPGKNVYVCWPKTDR